MNALVPTRRQALAAATGFRHHRIDWLAVERSGKGGLIERT